MQTAQQVKVSSTEITNQKTLWFSKKFFSKVQKYLEITCDIILGDAGIVITGG